MKSENCEHQLSFILKVGKNEIWRMEITPPNYSISPFSVFFTYIARFSNARPLLLFFPRIGLQRFEGFLFSSNFVFERGEGEWKI